MTARYSKSLALLLAAAAFFVTMSSARADDKGAWLSFSTKPSGATIYLDKVRLGLSPLTSWKVQAGWHTVRFEKAGFEPVSYGCAIKAGQKKMLTGTLHPKPKKSH